ncbi:hypothetical protein YC2023_084523 [Brassica napus]
MARRHRNPLGSTPEPVLKSHAREQNLRYHMTLPKRKGDQEPSNHLIIETKITADEA